ncbi:MAG: ATP-dependent DNA ligase [Bacteroidetes bacterium]|nr:ATP-dependent DNA ligase [Bacteroidota bacterium]
MNAFVTLIIALGKTNSINAKQALLAEYFSSANDQDKLWTIALFTGKKPKRTLPAALLKKWCAAYCQIPEWLFNESYHTVGDLAETIALLLPAKGEEMTASSASLSDIIEQLSDLSSQSDEEKKAFILQQWQQLDRNACFVFNKLITGGFRIGISQSMIYNALAKAIQKSAGEIAYLFSGKWHPTAVSFKELLSKENAVNENSKPYPFYLAYPLENSLIDNDNPDDWIAEWKWDGIRGQCIKRNQQHFIWSRGEELITEQFPELHELLLQLPDGTVVDGEILCANPTSNTIEPLPFALLQKRITRKRLNTQILQEAPAIFVAYDLLEWNQEDIRQKPIIERQRILSELTNTIKSPHFKCSTPILFENWEQLRNIRNQSRENSTEGLMLKRKTSTYQSGRKKGDWWKWKVDPFTIDGVLIYAQKGHGRRSNLYTDYTFAVKDGDKLISFTKAYSGLTDAEFKEVDAFVKKNALEKFGPVRTVKPELVFEIAFEGISESKRHKAGIALRFPRMKRLRKDKSVEDINTLSDLKQLLLQHGKTYPL